MQETSTAGFGQILASMGDGVVWIFQNIALAFYNLGYAITNPSLWLDWSDKQAIMRFVYYGGSVEFFFVVFTTFLIVTAIGMWKHNFMWAMRARA